MALKLKLSPKKHLHNWLIPHAGNAHHPHLVRPRGLAAMAVAILLIQVFSNLAISGRAQVLGYAANITAGDIIYRTNQERVKAGLRPLRTNSALNSAAAAKAKDMFAHNYWAHVSPSGVTPWYWFRTVGYGYSYAGENLAKDFDTSSGVVAGWMASGPHRQNILSTHYRDIGVAVRNGTLQGGQTTLVVQMLGSLAVAPLKAAAPATTPQTAQPSPQPIKHVHHKTKPTTHSRQVTPKISQTLAAESAPAKTNYNLFHPLLSLRALRPGDFATIGMLGMGMLVDVMRHTAIWRKRPRGAKGVWFRSHPLLQAGLLGLAIVIVMIGGFGVVG